MESDDAVVESDDVDAQDAVWETQQVRVTNFGNFVEDSFLYRFHQVADK